MARSARLLNFIERLCYSFLAPTPPGAQGQALADRLRFRISFPLCRGGAAFPSPR